MQNRLVQRRPLLTCCLMLLLAETPGHGYEVTERLKQWGFDLAGPGPVYRELRLLEEAGFVRSMWSAPQSGPVPRVYELTDEGHDALDQASADLDGLRAMIDEFQGRFQAVQPAPAPPAPAPAEVTVAPAPAKSARTRRGPRSAPS
ncbi:MAG: PadR family transcriptional regulator [Acidimicrobiales bacterium]